MSFLILLIAFLTGIFTTFLIIFVSSFSIQNDRIAGMLNLIDRGKLDGQHCSFCESGLRLGIEKGTMRTAKWCPKCLKIIEIFDAPIFSGRSILENRKDDDDFLKKNRLKF